MVRSENFKFGLESEYVVLKKSTGQALWQDTLDFASLNALLESISLSEIPSLDGLDLEKPHRKHMPYVVEGYHVHNEAHEPIDMRPKGLEIRTPVCNSIDHCLEIHQELLKRLALALKKIDLAPLALSHHPVAAQFRGPQGKRRHDFWQWAMEVMTTYGPDINVGVPDEIWNQIDFDDFLAKINFYAPAMTAFSVASPFTQGGLWQIRGQQGYSLRTYRRSVVAPPIEIHRHENNRLEFKVFDMNPNPQEVQGYFELFLTLLLDPQLVGRASNSTRIYDSGEVAVTGWSHTETKKRGALLIERALKVLPAWGFGTQGVESLARRIDLESNPAQELIELYQNLNGDLNKTLIQRAKATFSDDFAINTELHVER